jgi:predicted nucleic-acid-binding Zn-ribbon protein
MTDEAKLKCPSCGSHDVESRELGIRGFFCRVAFGTGFEKDDIMAHACRECRFIFLERVERTSTARWAARLFSRFRRQ